MCPGEAVISDEIIRECIGRLFDEYLLPASVGGRLNLRLNKRVADQDSFGPLSDLFSLPSFVREHLC